MLEQAIAAYKAGDYRQCLDVLDPLVARPDTDARLLLMAAQSHVKLFELEQAADLYIRAAAFEPQSRAMLLLLGARTYGRARCEDAALSWSRVAAREAPRDPEAQNSYRQNLRHQLCLAEMEAEDARLRERMQVGEAEAFAIDDPHDHIMWCDDEALNARITRMPSGAAFTEQSRAARRAMPHRFADRIRIGYLSNDFSDQHATMRLLQGVLMSHDRTRFDVTLFCHTPQDVRSTDRGMRARWGRIVDIAALDDSAARDTIRAEQIDILIDLKGHTRDGRVDLINSGLAPIQVAYLGFPGTGNGIDCDYVIGDPIVTPPSAQPFFHEMICRLPECYQPNDAEHRLRPPAASRESLGLPADAFVLASFNAVKKITAQTARLWAAVMRDVPNALLWMMCDSAAARRHFTAYMGTLGIEAGRIVYANRAGYEAHIARVQAADLALDSFPTNGHTTTSDMLWAGLPVATRRGRNFTSRVSESLLHALGVPELVAADDEAFVDLCIALARDPARLSVLRQKIDANRLTMPLFDTQRYTRHLESAYEMMVARARQGLPPAPFDVTVLPVPDDRLPGPERPQA